MDKLKVFLSESEIQKMVLELAQKIQADYERTLKKGENLLVVVTLKGAALFASDLVKRLKLPVLLDFVRLSSYGSGTSSSGTVRILKDMESSPTGAHVLVLDEIVDSGRTLTFLKGRILAAEPKTLKLCALLSKPSRREVEIDVDYLGCDVEDKFLVGYGLDKAEQYRNLPDIYQLE